MIFQLVFVLSLLSSEIFGSPVLSKTRSNPMDSFRSRSDKDGPPPIACTSDFERAKRNVHLPPRTWPKGIVPVKISPQYNVSQRETILNAMREIENKTCVRFVVKPGNASEKTAHVEIKKGNTCSASYLGWRAGKVVNVSLGKGCIDPHIVLHELLHVLGLEHQQNTLDRDNFVTIHLENIEKGEQYNFKKVSKELPDLGLPYDFCSVMHYDTFSFSKNKKPTIVPKIPGVTLRWAYTMSYLDTLKINIAYNCHKYLNFSGFPCSDYYADCSNRL